MKMFKQIDESDLERWFTYRTPDEGQVTDMENIRYSALILAKDILGILPDGPQKTLAIRHLRELVMTANLGIMFPEDGQ